MAHVERKQPKQRTERLHGRHLDPVLLNVSHHLKPAQLSLNCDTCGKKMTKELRSSLSICATRQITTSLHQRCLDPVLLNVSNYLQMTRGRLHFHGFSRSKSLRKWEIIDKKNFEEHERSSTSLRRKRSSKNMKDHRNLQEHGRKVQKTLAAGNFVPPASPFWRLSSLPSRHHRPRARRLGPENQSPMDDDSDKEKYLVA